IVRAVYLAIIRVTHPMITRGVALPVVGRGANPADVGAVPDESAHWMPMGASVQVAAGLHPALRQSSVRFTWRSSA
ncbi:hypothetical protein, partial [Parazoarcus communis]|uniref:hypothetical protein n=1 Tax=Parazoarcus communis TaxID=41977 RepID=UPI001B7D210D